MLTIYNYEELAEDIQKKVRAREMATETYRRYKLDFYKERREELLGQEFGEYMETHEVITLYQPESVVQYKDLDVAYYDKQTKKTTVKVFINEETDYQYLSFIVDSFNTRMKDIIRKIEHEAESIEPDFAQYLQDKNFLEDGTEIVLTTAK
jgi:hypothetical protein